MEKEKSDRIRYIGTVIALIWAYFSPTVLWLIVITLCIDNELKTLINRQTAEDYRRGYIHEDEVAKLFD